MSTETSATLQPKDGASVGAFCAVSGRPRAGLVVLQEIFGVNDHIRSVCRRLAKLGYGVIAPALFDRVEALVELNYDSAGVERGKALRGAITDETALLDVQAAIVAASTFGKVAVVGYCWGGRLAWLAAARCSGLHAAVGYYPGGIGSLADETPRVPVMLHFGERDPTIPMAEVDALRSRHAEVQTFLYPAGHGFCCDARAGFDADIAQRAEARTRDFLEPAFR